MPHPTDKEFIYGYEAGLKAAGQPVAINAGQVAYDDSASYTDGTVGGEIHDLNECCEVATADIANLKSEIINLDGEVAQAQADIDLALVTAIDEAVTLTSTAGVYNKTGTIEYAQYANMVHYNVTVTGGQRYQVSAYSQGNTSYPFINFFDSESVQVGIVQSGDNTFVTKEVLVPPTAVTMAINHNTNSYAAKCFLREAVSTKEYVNTISKGNTEVISNLMPKQFTESVTLPASSAGVLNSNGNADYAQYSNYVHYDLSVSEFEWYEIYTWDFGNASYPFAIIYKNDGTIHSRIYSGASGGNKRTMQIQIPADCTRLSFNDDKNQIATPTVKQGVYQSVEDYVSDQMSYWKGKKIVWFGTSIPAGVAAAGATNGTGAYPNRIGDMLGATVYNESIGSSQVRAGSHGSAVTEDDPYGYGANSAVGLMYSLSLSSSEKQDIIDNWDSKWKDIITWYADQLDFANKTSEYLASSWDNLLAKYLTGGSVGPVDLYVFDHGYNDGCQTIGYTDLDDTPATAKDRTYFLGALHYIFDKILTDNPKARILIVGHYCTDGRSGNFLTSYVTEAQTKAAETWQYPFIETWKYMGFNHQTITISGTDTTPADSWMPDGVHPSSDTTGAALKHYAEVLYPFVRDIR